MTQAATWPPRAPWAMGVAFEEGAADFTRINPSGALFIFMMPFVVSPVVRSSKVWKTTRGPT